MERAHTEDTLSEKIEVINYVELHSIVPGKIANLFDVEKTLSGWIKNKDDLKQSISTGTSGINAQRKSTSKNEIIDSPRSNGSERHEATQSCCD